MITVLYIATGGALGAILRYGISVFFKYYFPYFPVGTLFVNFSGSILIGLLVSYSQSQLSNPLFVKYFLIIGFLGSFTTFSAFSLESLEMFNDKKILISLTYIFLSVFLCIFGAGIGYLINKI